MDTDRGFRSERNSISHNAVFFNSVGGHLAKNLAATEHNSTEFGSSLRPGDFTQSFIKQKNEFLPFLNERDKMNRLISNSLKPDSNRVYEPSNPSLYYKSERFNKVRLRFDQAERNRQSLFQLLQFKTEDNDQSNILDIDKATRLQKATIGKSLFSRNSKRLAFDEGTQEDYVDFLNDKYAINLDLLEPDFPNQKGPPKTGPITPCLLKNLNDMKNSKKQNMLELLNVEVQRKNYQKGKHGKSRSEIIPKKKLTLPKDDFCNFICQIDNDMRTISTSSVQLRQKTRTNFNNLNDILAKYEGQKLFRQTQTMKSNPPPTFNTFSVKTCETKRIDSSETHNIPEGIFYKRSQSEDKLNALKKPKVFQEQRRKKLMI